MPHPNAPPHAPVKEAANIKYHEGGSVSVALVMQHAKHRRRVTLSSVWPVWLYHIFTHYLINSTIVEKKVMEHKYEGRTESHEQQFFVK